MTPVVYLVASAAELQGLVLAERPRGGLHPEMSWSAISQAELDRVMVETCCLAGDRQGKLRDSERFGFWRAANMEVATR